MPCTPWASCLCSQKSKVMPNPNIQTLCRPDIQDSMQPFWPSNAESLPCDCFLLKQICIVLIHKHFGQANFRREFHWNSNKAIHHSILQYSTTGNYNISRGYRYQEQAMHNTLILDIIHNHDRICVWTESVSFRRPQQLPGSLPGANHEVSHVAEGGFTSWADHFQKVHGLGTRPETGATRCLFKNVWKILKAMKPILGKLLEPRQKGKILL